MRKVKRKKQTKQENAEPKDTQEKPAPKDKTIVRMENDFHAEVFNIVHFAFAEMAQLLSFCLFACVEKDGCRSKTQKAQAHPPRRHAKSECVHA